MKTFLKRLFLKPVLTLSDFLIIFGGSQIAGSLFDCSFWLYLLFLINGLVAIAGVGHLSGKYYEVVNNEFEKEDSK